MGLRFKKLVQADGTHIEYRSLAESTVRSMGTYDKMVFMSHKTGDRSAEREADYIAGRHGVDVYMAEWDDNVDGDSDDLPSYIMNAIRRCDGFLVNVVDEIRISMWIGYEIGGAHAMRKSRAKIMYHRVSRLPSVVGALEALANRSDLNDWVRRYVL